jgi:hypothetical protein
MTIIHDVHNYLLHGEDSPKANPKQLLQRLLDAYNLQYAHLRLLDLKLDRAIHALNEANLSLILPGEGAGGEVSGADHAN